MTIISASITVHLRLDLFLLIVYPSRRPYYSDSATVTISSNSLSVKACGVKRRNPWLNVHDPELNFDIGLLS